jgi:hypothetical protein
MDPESRLYVLDLWREQTSSEKWIEAFCDLVLHWRPLDWAEEQGQIKASVGPFLSRRQHERKAYVNREPFPTRGEAYVNREPFPTRGDKAVRAQSIRGRMAARKAGYHGAWGHISLQGARRLLRVTRASRLKRQPNEFRRLRVVGQPQPAGGSNPKD